MRNAFRQILSTRLKTNQRLCVAIPQGAKVGFRIHRKSTASSTFAREMEVYVVANLTTDLILSARRVTWGPPKLHGFGCARMFKQEEKDGKEKVPST